MFSRGLLLSAVIVVAVCGCAQPLRVPPATLASQPATLPAPSPEATAATVAPTQVPTPLPTLEPLEPTVPPAVPTIDATHVVATITAAQTDLAAREVQALCLRFEDADGDTIPDWIGLYMRPSDPPRLSAFVIRSDGGWHDLNPQEGNQTGLGAYPTCELEVRDINADAIPEVLIFGHAGTSTTLLHVFAWREDSYALVAAFEGNAGIALENHDGDLAEEIVVGYAKDSQLVWEVVYTWDGLSYGWTWDRYRWRALGRPHVYTTERPEAALISFYLALNDRDLPSAYRMLSTAAQANMPYAEWALGYATTVQLEAGAVHETGVPGEDSTTVAALVRSYENADGHVVVRLSDVEWLLVREGDAWHLDHPRIVQLDEWEAIYYP